ncbi:MAG: hypothetical protein WCO35_02960 [Candidatus Nomurabacteria bacterium]
MDQILDSLFKEINSDVQSGKTVEISKNGNISVLKEVSNVNNNIYSESHVSSDMAPFGYLLIFLFLVTVLFILFALIKYPFW